MRKCLLTLIAILSATLYVCAQWNDNPSQNNRITPANQEVYDWEIQTNDDGITYVMFSGPTGGNTTTFLQVLDKDGRLLFPEEGKLISNEETRSYTVVNDLMMIDKEGNAIIAVSDCRNAPADSKELSYTLYKVSPTGEMLWGEDGIDIENGRTHSIEANIKMVQIEDGSYVIAWMTSYGSLQRICMQRISSDGELLWEDIELKDENITYSYPYLANAGNNQVILIYAKGTNQDLMAKKIDFDGSAVWPEDTRIYRGGFGSTPLQTVLSITPDPNGGIFVGWHDDRYYTNTESAFVSYVKPNGELGYTAGEDGQQVGYAGFRSFAPEMMYDKDENALYVIWRETTAGQGQQRLMAQKVAMSGELLWSPEGIEVRPWESNAIGYYSIQSGKEKDFAVFYMIQEEYGRVFAYASLLDGSTGAYKWEKETITLSSYVSEKGNLQSTPLINESFWLTMWADHRTEQKSLFLQKINADGSFGSTTSIDPNSIVDNNNFRINYLPHHEGIEIIIDKENSGNIDISIYSIDGKKMGTIYKSHIEKGQHSINWHNKNTGDHGIYIIMLTTDEYKTTQKIVLP